MKEYVKSFILKTLKEELNSIQLTAVNGTFEEHFNGKPEDLVKDFHTAIIEVSNIIVKE